jgi:hypothetical protein
MAEMDIKLQGGKREDYKNTSERLRKWSNVLFANLRSGAYIGRAYQMLIIYLNMPFR